MSARVRFAASLIAALFAVGACQAGGPAAGPTDPAAAGPGTSAAPREVNLIAKDYLFLPDAVVFRPGETVLLHVINGGLEVHEAIIGDAAVQDAWEAVEAATVGGPPGATPLVSVPPEVSGIRIVVHSGERVDLVWTIPPDVASGPAWVVGCHIPGHWAQGMQIPVHWATKDGTGSQPPGAS